MDTQKDPEMYASAPLSTLELRFRRASPTPDTDTDTDTNTNQHLRNNDRRSHRLLGYLHALRPRRLARQLPPLRLPPG